MYVFMQFRIQTNAILLLNEFCYNERKIENLQSQHLPFLFYNAGFPYRGEHEQTDNNIGKKELGFSRLCRPFTSSFGRCTQHLQARFSLLCILQFMPLYMCELCMYLAENSGYNETIGLRSTWRRQHSCTSKVERGRLRATTRNRRRLILKDNKKKYLKVPKPQNNNNNHINVDK